MVANSGPGAVATTPVVIPPGAKADTPDPLARAYDLPCTLLVEVPAVEFSVGSMMALRPGAIVRTAAQQNEDLALKVNGQLVGLVEFDVVGERLAVRLTGMV